jgi:hypothetical protein
VTLPPTTTRTIAGTVEVLDQVWFAGHAGPSPGSGCLGRGGYSDLSPGAPVLLTDGGGRGIGATSLGAGAIVQRVKRSDAEWREREGLIDSIYELRMAQAYGDSVRVAELRLERARLRLHDLENKGRIDLSFEGRAFVAAYCKFEFRTPPLADLPAYGFGVTHRGVVRMSNSELASKGWVAALEIG